MTLQAKLKLIRDTLVGLNLNVYHYYNAKPKLPYVVWAEDSEADSFYAGNHKAEQVIHGTIDYYTKTEFDSNADTIQGALNALPIGWRLSSVQYEEETNLIHYEWEFEIGEFTN